MGEDCICGLPVAGSIRFHQTESTSMHTDARLSSLQQKHLRLDQAITDEAKRSWPDEGALKRMKLEKLHIKEEIDRLSRASSRAH
jgi:hypothetical protein